MGEFLVAVGLAVAVVVLVGVMSRFSRSPQSTPAQSVAPPAETPILGEIVASMSEGVLVLNASLIPSLANPSARAMLDLGDGPLPPRVASDELVSTARRALAEDTIQETQIELWPRRIHVFVRAVPLGEGVVVFMRDVTEEQRTQQIRKQFVVNASHELKTPVASMQAIAEAIQKAISRDPQRAQQFADSLLDEAQRLNALVADLLDLSKLEDPSQIFSNEVDLGAVAHDEYEQMTAIASSQSVKLDERIEQGVLIRGDEQQIALMVRNLLDNAIKYTPEGGSVMLEVDGDGEARLRVSDTGIGIPLQDQGRVFERFYRVDEGRARPSGGTGLGLSIVRHVAELHGGRVTLQSELDEGSIFTVFLPRPPSI